MSFAIGGPTSKWAKTSAKSANYTILDDDEIGVILATTGDSANITMNLPTLADNIDRVIEIVKVDDGTKFVEINPEGSETVRGSTTSIYAIQQGESIRLLATASDWVLLGDPYRRVGCYITNSGSAAISSQSGAWLSGVTRNSVGDVTLNINTGSFLAAPFMSATSNQTGYFMQGGSAFSTSAANFVSRVYDGTIADINFNVVAIGKK